MIFIGGYTKMKDKTIIIILLLFIGALLIGFGIVDLLFRNNCYHKTIREFYEDDYCVSLTRFKK